MESQQKRLLRLLNNLCCDMGQLSQRIDDILAMFDYETIGICDRLTMVQLQNRVVKLESEKLWKQARDLDTLLTTAEICREAAKPKEPQ